MIEYLITGDYLTLAFTFIIIIIENFAILTITFKFFFDSANGSNILSRLPNLPYWTYL